MSNRAADRTADPISHRISDSTADPITDPTSAQPEPGSVTVLPDPNDPLAAPNHSLPDPNDPVFAMHAGGKLEVVGRTLLRSRRELSLAYTPGVAQVSLAIAANPELLDVYTGRGNLVAVVTDGTAVLGLGISDRAQRCR